MPTAVNCGNPSFARTIDDKGADGEFLAKLAKKFLKKNIVRNTVSAGIGLFS